MKLYGDIDLGQHWLSNGLLPGGTKPLIEPMLTYYQWGLVVFSWEQFHRNFYSVKTVYIWKVQAVYIWNTLFEYQ